MLEYELKDLINMLLDGIRACTATKTKYVPIEVNAAREIKAHLECFQTMINECEDDGK